MSTCGETISFCATSVGRNTFLQISTGVFGGDPSWGIGTYTPVNENYRNSPSYRSTVATSDEAYQRAPSSCWYTMGTATVNSVQLGRVRLLWTISNALWNNVRNPGQCFSFCDAGVLIHGILSTTSTQKEAVVDLSSSLTLSLQPGDPVPYMIRQRPPRNVIPGPIEIGIDGQTVLVQGTSIDLGFVRPEASSHLLYVVRRGNHPLRLCEMDSNPDNARQWVFAVDDVSFQPASAATPMYALQSQVLHGTGGFTPAWRQLTEWLHVGTVLTGGSFIVSGIHYEWPFPSDESGKAWMLAPVNQSNTTAPFRGRQTPTAVYFVRASTARVPVNNLVDGVQLQDGDRVLVMEVPWCILQWTVTTMSFSTIQSTFPQHVLVVVEPGGTANGRTGWLSEDGLTWLPYRVLVAADHAKGSDAFLRNSVNWELPSDHAFVILTRRADGLYAATPVSVTSNLGNVNPVGWAWTYPLNVNDGTDRFDGHSATDGLMGLPRNLNPSRDIDYACLRRRVGARLASDPRPPEYLRLNIDMGVRVVLDAIAWAIVMDGVYPTITVHGSNDPAFFVDQVVTIPSNQRTVMGIYTQNQHSLNHGANLLWMLCVDREGSAWTTEELANGTADIYMMRLASEPRYSRLTNTGQTSLPDFTGWAGAHMHPTTSTTSPAYQYFALTVSVGLLTSTRSHTIEVQEFQPLVVAPKAAASNAAELYGRGLLPDGTGKYAIKLNRPVPTGVRGQMSLELGYIEIWDSFKVRTAFHQGQAWSISSFPSQPGAQPGRARRASVSLSEVLLPRYALVRSSNIPVTALPYLWCFVRHRAMQAVGDQSTIINRLVEPDRVLEASLQPPQWTIGRDTIWFQLTVPSARIPGEAHYIGLASSNAVQVNVTDTIGSALPEFCLVLPSGEILDFIQYDGNIVLPNEVPHDDWSGINAMLTVQFEEPVTTKRPRT